MSKKIVWLLFTLTGWIGAACTPSELAPKPPGVCAGEQRPPLNCDAEFSYDARMVKGGFSALGLGAQAQTEVRALREIDEATRHYAAASRRLCDEYNNCVMSKAEYAARSDEMRRFFLKMPTLYADFKDAGGAEARRRALASAYEGLVPDTQRSSLWLEFTVLAKRPGDEGYRPSPPGVSLPTNTRVAFVVKTSSPAHFYLLQKNPRGQVNVLFPDPRVAIANPIPGNVSLRVPTAPAAYRVNEEDSGTKEHVFVVASLQPVQSLQQALERAQEGVVTGGVIDNLGKVQPLGANHESCPTRALELDVASDSPCFRSRGLELSTEEGESVSFRAKTEAADTMIVEAFSFEHTK